jgi:hypothetical protein
MATDTTMGIAIGTVGSGKSTIMMNGIGTMPVTITTGIAVTGAVTMTTVAREATGTTSTGTATGGMTTDRGWTAVATGMTPDNVAASLSYFTHYLLGTGVSRDTHHFD